MEWGAKRHAFLGGGPPLRRAAAIVEEISSGEPLLRGACYGRGTEIHPFLGSLRCAG